ncbi:zinc-binding dehydrogenase [Streptomyces sp. NPDC052051]|uniref:zinc-binding dehydrogenase n=1 Tax=Streptomyces sp. NPDC052051 TaxID=3154649 RepID=UPI00343026BD
MSSPCPLGAVLRLPAQRRRRRVPARLGWRAPNRLLRMHADFPQETGRALRRAVAAAASGDLRVRVETLPLERAAEAHRRIESGATTGKLVLQAGAL